MIAPSEKRVYRNTLALTLRTFLTIPIGFFSVRISLNLLGAADYGMANVLGAITSVALVLSGCIAGTSKRFLCFDLASVDVTRTRRLFSMLLIVHLVSAIGLGVFLEGFGCWMITTKVAMPSECIPVAVLFYQTVVLGFIIQHVGGAYSTLLTAYEDISVIAWVSLAESIVHLLLMVALMGVGLQSLLVPYGLVNLMAFVFSASFYYAYARRHHPDVSKYVRHWDGALFRRLFGFTFWQLLAGVSGSVYGIVNNVLLNNYFTSVLNAAKGISDMVNGKIAGFGYVVMSASQPQLIKLYAQGEIEKLEGLFIRITKLSFFILLVLGVPFFMNLEYFLRLWLKDPPPFSGSFAALGFMTALVDVTCVPGNTVIDATGRIRGMQMVRATCPWLFLAVVYIGIIKGMGPLWIPTVALISASFANIIRFAFIKHLIPQFGLGHFAVEILRRTVLPLILAVASLLTARLLCPPDGAFPALVGSGATAMVLAGGIWTLGLTAEERSGIVNWMRRKWKGERNECRP